MLELSVTVGIVVGLSEVVKRATPIPGKYIPVVNLVLGIALCVFTASGDLRTAAVEGIIVGLTASGLYSSGKNVMQGLEKKRIS